MRRVFYIAVFLLAACGGGGGSGGTGGSGMDPRLGRLDVYESQRMRVLGDPDAGATGMAPTPDAAMPDVGSATFDGFVIMQVEPTGSILGLVGDATVTVGFGAAAISGRMDNFFGRETGGDIANYSGTISIDGGTIGVAQANAVTLDYGGVLSGPGDTLVVGGTMDGAFLGNPIGALSAVDPEVGATRNGAPTDGTLVLIGETPGVVPP
ncbi:hypothetical protein ACJ5NV_08250 [Loktanella agnita]|uniref:hypothetical protein n=1 Tax=Loktanella agnita TaxID=287097 RepID=UPI003988314C